MFNINLNYDINQALDTEELNGDFHAISLHGAIKHLASEVKNIKDFLWRMGKYIRGKSIDSNPNNIKDLEGVGKVVWEFLSSIYNLYWDSLYVDNTNTIFRNKVSSKFTPRVPKNSNIDSKDKDMVKSTFIFSISLLFQLNHRKKSMSFRNISRRTPTRSRRSLTPMPLLWPNHPAHPPQRTSLMKCWKSRRHSRISQIRRLSKFKKSSMAQTTNPNRGSPWLLRVSQGNKLLF